MPLMVIIGMSVMVAAMIAMFDQHQQHQQGRSRCDRARAPMIGIDRVSNVLLPIIGADDV